MLHGLLKATSSTQFLTCITSNSSRWIVAYENIHQRLHRPNCLECDPSSILETIIGTPAYLAILYPILIYCIPFMASNNLCYPMAALIVIVGYFFHKAHKLRKIVEV